MSAAEAATRDAADMAKRAEHAERASSAATDLSADLQRKLEASERSAADAAAGRKRAVTELRDAQRTLETCNASRDAAEALARQGRSEAESLKGKLSKAKAATKVCVRLPVCSASCGVSHRDLPRFPQHSRVLMRLQRSYLSTTSSYTWPRHAPFLLVCVCVCVCAKPEVSSAATGGKPATSRPVSPQMDVLFVHILCLHADHARAPGRDIAVWLLQDASEALRGEAQRATAAEARCKELQATVAAVTDRLHEAVGALKVCTPVSYEPSTGSIR